VRRRGLLPLLLLGAGLSLVVAIAGVGGLRRRIQLLALYGAGNIPDMTWQDIARMLPPKSGYDVEGLLAVRNPYVALRNPFTQPSDLAAGKESFEGQCAVCHGRGARGAGGGGGGPDLTTGAFRHGASDWALYRTIIGGVPGTAMQPHPLPARTAWQLVAYVRSVSQGSHADLATGTDSDSARIAPADSSIISRLEQARRHPPVPSETAITPPQVTYERLKGASRDSASWLTYSGTYDGQRHSRLSQVNRHTVSRLKLSWLFPLSTTEKVETSPLVVGTTMYLTTPPSDAWALDARTGALLWSYVRPIPDDLRICCGRQNRGVAVLGNTLYVGTMDAHLIALDATTGAVKWDVKVADYRDGYTITGAPLAVDGQIITGVGGGEFGIQGFLDSYDPGSGRLLWRFRTIPGPGVPGHETWGGDSWKAGGGPTWMTGTFDPDLGLLYWGVGNPGPDYQGNVRPGDNLYTNSVVALDVHTGRLRWHYQFTPHDQYDWDATQIPVLVDAMLGGKPRKLLLEANRNGFYYVLDRESGAFLFATPFVKQTWSDGFDSAGRPRIRPGMSPRPEGTLVNPGAAGGTNWWPPSYDPQTESFLVQTKEATGIFFNTPDVTHVQGDVYMGSAGENLPGMPGFSSVRALQATTGKLRWQFRPEGAESKSRAGVLSTDGGLVFVGGRTVLYALDARTGAVLWSISTGAEILAAPVTYLVEGKQVVTVPTGHAILSFTLDGR
jgi:alcohol dehydrogenase (cytochrome c)